MCGYTVSNMPNVNKNHLQLELQAILYIKYYCNVKISVISVCLIQGPRHRGARGARAPCSDPNSTDKRTYLVFGSLKLLKPKAHFTN